MNDFFDALVALFQVDPSRCRERLVTFVESPEFSEEEADTFTAMIPFWVWLASSTQGDLNEVLSSFKSLDTESLENTELEYVFEYFAPVIERLEETDQGIAKLLFSFLAGELDWSSLKKKLTESSNRDVSTERL